MVGLGLLVGLIGCSDEKLSCPLGTTKSIKEYSSFGNYRHVEYCIKDNNTKHGPVMELYADGTVKVEGKYKDNKKHGRWTSWYKNKKINEKISYVDGEEDGLWIRWNELGTKMKEQEFDKGEANEVYRDWHSNGQLHEEGECKDGNMHSNWTKWDENGKVLGEKSYVDGHQSTIYGIELKGCHTRTVGTKSDIVYTCKPWYRLKVEEFNVPK